MYHYCCREERYVDMAVCAQIMTVEQAQAFALQRYRSDREATAFIGQLMSTYGFLPSCVGEFETLVIGDTEEIWIFEVFSVGSDGEPGNGEPGAIWVAQRVPDDHALVVANWRVIKEVVEKDTANFMYSTNYKQFAVDRAYVPIYAGTREIAACYKYYGPTTYSNRSACWAIDLARRLRGIDGLE